MPRRTKEQIIKEANERWLNRPYPDEKKMKKNRQINNNIQSSYAYPSGWSGSQYKSVRG